MEINLQFSIADRLRSFKCAFKGLITMLSYEHNAWIHTVATAAVCGVAFYLGLTRYEWCLVILAIVSVWTAEALNTALEFLCDVASPNFHPLVEKAKDVAAGAVLISTIGSVIIGLFVMGPYLMQLLRSALAQG